MGRRDRAQEVSDDNSAASMEDRHSENRNTGRKSRTPRPIYSSEYGTVDSTSMSESTDEEEHWNKSKRRYREKKSSSRKSVRRSPPIRQSPRRSSRGRQSENRERRSTTNRWKDYGSEEVRRVTKRHSSTNSRKSQVTQSKRYPPVYSDSETEETSQQSSCEEQYKGRRHQNHRRRGIIKNRQELPSWMS